MVKPYAPSKADEYRAALRILGGTSELRKNNMRKFFKDRRDAVRYVIGLLQRSRQDLPLTTTIEPVKSGGFCVSSVTGTSSEDTQTQRYSSGVDVT
jgi:hypothetical protein